MPFDGAIDWDAALMALQKIGYDGVLDVRARRRCRTPGGPRARAAGPRNDWSGCRTRVAHRPSPQRPRARSLSDRFDPMRAYIQDIARHEGQTVTIHGWLHNRRSSGKIHFLQVRDGTGFIQAVMSKAAVGDEAFTRADHLSQETSLIVTGTVRADARAPGGYEIDVTRPRGHRRRRTTTRSRRRSTASTTCWTAATSGSARQRQQAILRVRHEVIDAVRDFFNSRGFILCDTPIFTPAACEGTTTLFPVQYFEDTTAYLTQSGQLYNEANAMALGRVYCFGPTFRAEKSKTRRHLTEFWMVEPEMAYADLDDVIELAEGLVVDVVGAGARQAPDGAEGARARHVEARGGQGAVPADDLRRGGEDAEGQGPAVRVGRRLRRHRTRPCCRSSSTGRCACTAIPAAVKAFYMKPDPKQPDKALCVDVLAPEGYGEIIGGGQRLDDYDLLLQRIKEHNLPQEAFEWYLDLRRYGSVPHGGFGMGIERVVVVDLRPRARARDDSVPADAVPAVSVRLRATGSRLGPSGLGQTSL